jgi:hypothetical protein
MIKGEGYEKWFSEDDIIKPLSRFIDLLGGSCF